MFPDDDDDDNLPADQWAEEVNPYESPDEPDEESEPDVDAQEERAE